VTKEELQQCPHHMIDYLCPLKEHHTVVDYRDMAVPIVSLILCVIYFLLYDRQKCTVLLWYGIVFVVLHL
jgi:hypothetical protein